VYRYAVASSSIVDRKLSITNGYYIGVKWQHKKAQTCVFKFLAAGSLDDLSDQTRDMLRLQAGGARKGHRTFRDELWDNATLDLSAAHM
jgi:hypothetical protein